MSRDYNTPGFKLACILDRIDPLPCLPMSFRGIPVYGFGVSYTDHLINPNRLSQLYTNPRDYYGEFSHLYTDGIANRVLKAYYKFIERRTTWDEYQEFISDQIILSCGEVIMLWVVNKTEFKNRSLGWREQKTWGQRKWDEKFGKLGFPDLKPPNF